MAKQFQPLTLQVTTSPHRLRSQLLAAWPAAPHAAARLRAIKTITTHIKDSLPAEYKGDISVFISNEASTIHKPVTQGFLYHLTSQQIVNRQPVKKANNTALLHVHFTAAQGAEETEEELKNAETTPVSRIQQIKQWQKETVKAMFQAMADTAISMESQTALRGTMAGLNKLGALLNKAVAAQKLPQSIAKVAAQKTASRDIASTLSDLRSNLSLASGNGLKPPTKSQMALRQQLNKLDKIAPTLQKPAAKTAPAVKSTPSVKSTPVAKSVPAPAAKSSVSSRQAITQRFSIKAEPERVARISIQPLRLNTVAKTYVAPRAATQSTPIRVLPRRVITPARIITSIAQRISLPVTAAPTQRYVATATKTIIQKIAQRPVAPKNTAAPSQILSRLSTPRFQISRPIIARLRVTPTIIAAHQALRTPTTVTEQKAKADPAKQEKQAPPQSNLPKDVTPRDTKTLAATTKVALQPNIIATQSLGSKIPLRNTRAPAVYAALSPMISPLRQATVTHSHPVVATVTTPASQPRSIPQAVSLPPTRSETLAPPSVGVNTHVAAAIGVATGNTATPAPPPPPAPLATNTHVEAPVAQPAQAIKLDIQKPNPAEPVASQEVAKEPPPAPIVAQSKNRVSDITSAPPKYDNGASPQTNTPTSTSPTADKPPTHGQPPTHSQPDQPPTLSHTPLPLPPVPTNDGAPILPIPAPPALPTTALVTNPKDNVVTAGPPPTAIDPIPTHSPIQPTPKEVPTSNVVPFRQPDKHADVPVHTDISKPAVPGELIKFKAIKRPDAYNPTKASKESWTKFVATENSWIGRTQSIMNKVSGGRAFYNNTGTGPLFADPILPKSQEEKNPARKFYCKIFKFDCA